MPLFIDATVPLTIRVAHLHLITPQSAFNVILSSDELTRHTPYEGVAEPCFLPCFLHSFRQNRCHKTTYKITLTFLIGSLW